MKAVDIFSAQEREALSHGIQRSLAMLTCQIWKKLRTSFVKYNVMEFDDLWFCPDG